MPDISYLDVKPPCRILLGPGPSNISPRVQRAMVAPLVGHLDPYFGTVMDDTMSLLRFLFRTKNELTFPISGPGSAGREASLCNLLEPGDVAVIGVGGFFAGVLAENALRCGAEVIRVDAEWGRIIEPEAIEAALRAQKRVKLLALVHAETSTGVLQPLTEASRLAKQYGALFLVDAVASLGGEQVAVDDWGIDVCFSGSQKCISCPPGLAPITVNQGVLDILKKRTHRVPSFFWDLLELSKYWAYNRTKAYHHTAPINLVYALHEAVALIADEGLDSCIQRHHKHGSALQAGLEAMGLTLHAQQGYRMNVLASVCVPAGIDDMKIRQRLLDEYNIDIWGGFGKLKGQIWRIGLMGSSSTEENVLLVLFALGKLLAEEGYQVEPEAGVTAAIRTLRKEYSTVT